MVTLALFLYTPLTALFSWTSLGAGTFRFQIYLLGYELLAANKLWGYVPSALGLALVPGRAAGGRAGAGPVRSAATGAARAPDRRRLAAR